MYNKRPQRAGIRRVGRRHLVVGCIGTPSLSGTCHLCVTSDRSGRLDSADNLCAPREVCHPSGGQPLPLRAPTYTMRPVRRPRANCVQLPLADTTRAR